MDSLEVAYDHGNKDINKKIYILDKNVHSIKLHTFARQLKESVWVPAFATLDRKLAATLRTKRRAHKNPARLGRLQTNQYMKAIYISKCAWISGFDMV